MRFLPLTPNDRAEMLGIIGVNSIDDLYTDVPEIARRSDPVDLPFAHGELGVGRQLAAMASRNVPAASVPFFCGAGAYKHHVPASVDHLIQRSEFLTTYTPYQPEIAQGTLQSMFEFQSQVALLTGMDVANASMYDGSTACAEAVVMAARVTKRSKIIFSGGLHPHYAEAARTVAKHTGLTIVALPPAIDGESSVIDLIDSETACVVVQSPNVFGTITDLSPISAAAHAKGALVVSVFNEAVAFGLIAPPGDMGVDIVAGEGQSIGNALNYGGPYVGLFATRDKYVRQAPGRLTGETVDADGKRGFVLTLSTREQHIRRDKATSNICTNSGLCALAFTIHMTLLGEAGLTRLATLNHEAAQETADRLAAVPGVEVLTKRFFNEIAVRLPRSAAPVVEALAARGILGGVPYSRLNPAGSMNDVLLIATTETATQDDIEALGAGLTEVLA
jgi:glycine dehydrogenase subunit 1